MSARHTLTTPVTILAALVLLVGLAHTVDPAWSRRTGLDVWNAPAAEAVAHTASERGHDLDAAIDWAHEQIAASDHAVRGLIDRRVSLAAAVEELARINLHRDGFYNQLRWAHPPVTEERALLAHYAMGKVAQVLEDDPPRRAEVLARLGAEFLALSGGAWVPNKWLFDGDVEAEVWFRPTTSRR
jgi:hypothetical protein